MTALQKYARLEASGLWRPTEDAQRREVIVSVGDATLVITDTNDRPLTHWSLAAIERKGTGLPAIYHPDGDGSETLELPASEGEMIAAIDTLRRTVARRRPRPGRLRGLGAGIMLLVTLSLAVFWLPGALVDHALRVVPAVKRAEIGDKLMQRITRVSGATCSSPGGQAALDRLAGRLGTTRLAVLPGGLRSALALPGGTILVNRALVEDFEEPDVAAGHVLAETVRRDEDQRLSDLLHHAGVLATARLLTTGRLPDDVLDSYAETMLAAQPDPVEEERLLAAFAAAELRSTPYAYAIDISGETTFGLIEADPMRGTAASRPLLNDADWVRLQSICER